jgi:aspartyl-tRNA(Asn)/glutamyl-tRNA(Gln) amidotransferase subunit B
MNRRAFELALRTAIALNCEIPAFTKWDRKQYYYPDLPKGYQISQFDLPMSQNGYLAIRDDGNAFEPKRIGITRAHLEEDAGKSMHDEATGKADSRIDLNRTGTPLLEIVSEPDMRSPQEARAYLDELKLLLTYLDVSDCNMQEGSLRVDANVNLHIGEEKVPTPIVEVKNVNSFRAVERALSYETGRQYEVWLETGVKLGGPGGHKSTRGWDDQMEITRKQRQKEESSDYRYFPDPDLTPVLVSRADVDRLRSELSERPAETRERLTADYEIDNYDAAVIVNQGRPLVEYFEKLAKNSGAARRSSNWIQQDVLRTLNENDIGITEFPITAEALAELLRTIEDGTLDNSRAKDVFQKMVDDRSSAAEAMQELGIQKVDTSEMMDLCRELLANNPKVVSDLKGGNMKAVGALIGQAKRRNPNVNPAQIRELCLQLVRSED